jgi:hypothetical protein
VPEAPPSGATIASATAPPSGDASAMAAPPQTTALCAGGASGGTTTGANGGAPTPPSCDEGFSCADMGPCSLRAEGSNCVRVCSFDVEIVTLDDLAAFAGLGCEVLEGNLALRSSEFQGVLRIDQLREIDGSLAVARAPNVTAIQMPDLRSVDGGIRFIQLDSLASIELPSLETQSQPANVVAHGIEISIDPMLQAVELGSLQTAVQLQILSNASLTRVQADALRSVAFLIVSGHPELTTLGGLPALEHVGQWYVTGNPKLPECELDAIAGHVDSGCDLCEGNDDTATCP